jgi:acyl-coenzyme A synthetase/AMP-(fatty) acid ligase
MKIVESIFAQDPAGVAFLLTGHGITYGRFCQDIDAMAHWLASQGVRPGSRLGILPLGDQSYWSWVTHLASIRAGAVHATLSLGGGTFEKAQELGIERLVASQRLRADAARVPILFIRPKGLASLADQMGVPHRPWPDPETESAAGRLAFTSGTTGTPRGLLWDYARMQQRIEQVRQRSRFTADTRLVVALGLMTTGGFRYPVAAWMAGAAVIRWGHPLEVPRPAPGVALKSNVMVASPINLRNHLERFPAKRWPGKDERRVLILGGRLPADTRDEALERACVSIEINYGSTETGSVAAGDAALVDRHPGAVGFARDGAEVEIVDEDQERPVLAGTPGIVRVRTSGMCEGYEGGDAPAGPFGFRDGYFYPGDLGILYPDGMLAIEGRASDVVNVAGVKLSTNDVEGRLAALPGVKDLCVVPVALKERDLLAVAAVVGNEVDLDGLSRDIKDALPRNCPFRLVRVKRIARNAMGKVPRREIAEQLRLALQEKG